MQNISFSADGNWLQGVVGTIAFAMATPPAVGARHRRAVKRRVNERGGTQCHNQ